MLKAALPLFLTGAVLLSACSESDESLRAHYDHQTGRLLKLEVDTNHNGIVDTVSFMDGSHIVRVELDLDENGKTERWDFYKPDGTLEKVGFSRLNDGIMDAQAFYQPEKVLARMEVSTKRDGQFDRVEFYQNGALTRAQEDTNGDGKADKWDSYKPVEHPKPGEPAYTITSTEFDDSGSGRPERRFVYGPGGVIARVEIDRSGSGKFEPIQATSEKPVKALARN
jgi:hypothetical protein